LHGEGEGRNSMNWDCATYFPLFLVVAYFAQPTIKISLAERENEEGGENSTDF
tara:strand:+ start:821 stop:979 length:159 start_codon:yes stop_codon:yes gene_type:complete